MTRVSHGLPGAPVGRLGELVNEAALAHAGLADDQCELRRRRPHGSLEQGDQPRDILFAADERGETVRVRSDSALGRQAACQPGRQGLDLALRDDAGKRLIHDGARSQLVREATGDDLARRRGRLQPRRGVDGVADEEAASRERIDVQAHEGLPGVDADAHLERSPVGASDRAQ